MQAGLVRVIFSNVNKKGYGRDRPTWTDDYLGDFIGSKLNNNKVEV